MANFLETISRVFRPSVKSTEGQSHEGPWWLPITGGVLPSSWGKYWNWWQLGYDPIYSPRSAMVQACISAYSQTVAMLPGDHWRLEDDDGRVRVKTSALSRWLRKPNAYQTLSDFLLRAVADLYADGNAYGLALRNDRNEIIEIHLFSARQSSARIAVDGSIFYHLVGNEVIERQIAAMGDEARGLLENVPARDVLHIRLEGKHPLKGETPLTAAALDIAMTNAMLRQAIAFYENQARPSGILRTEQELTKEQVAELRARWDEQSKGLSAGGTPILSNGLDWKAMTTSAKDTQYAEILKLSDTNIALVYRIPLQVLGLGQSTIGSTEQLMTMWIASGLGFCLNHVETALDRLFGLQGVPYEYLEFDTSVLLRSAFKDRVEAFVRSTQGGIHSPNEARKAFELKKMPGGDEPRVQMQVIPLTANDGDEPEPAPALPAPEDEPETPETEPEDEPEETDEDSKAPDPDEILGRLYDLV